MGISMLGLMRNAQLWRSMIGQGGQGKGGKLGELSQACLLGFFSVSLGLQR